MFCLNSNHLSLFFLFLIIFCKTIFAEVNGVIDRKEVVVHFIGTSTSAAKEIADMYPEVKRELEKTIGWKVDFKPIILLMNSEKDFQRMVENDLIVAYAVPQRGLIIINYPKASKSPFSVKSVLKHELCHLLLHKQIKSNKLPKWLDEGIAQWISGGITELIIEKKSSLLGKAILSGRNIPIRFLANKFPEEKGSLLLAYEESKSLVEYIRNNYGNEGIIRILENLKKGRSIDEAIRISLSISLEELENNWIGSFRKWVNWFAYLSNNLYELLFFLAALITVLAFIRILMKKRKYKDEEW